MPNSPIDTHGDASNDAADVRALVGDESTLSACPEESPQPISYPHVRGIAVAGATIAAQVRTLAFPMLGEQLLIFLVGLVDTLLAGTISKEATASVGTASYVAWFIQQSFALVGLGAAAVVSRSIGGGDRLTANRALNQALVLGLMMGAAMSVIAFALAPYLAGFLLPEEGARRLAGYFLRIDACGHMATCLTFVGMGVLRASGDAKTPLRIMSVVNIVNITLASTLVLGPMGLPSYGVTGIALGTLTARIVGAVIVLSVFIRGTQGLALTRALLKPERAMTWRMLRIGLPAAADSLIMAFAQVGFIWVVAHSAVGEAGTVAYAAHTIAMRIEALSYLPAFAWGTAAATIVGQYLGAHQPKEAARAGHVAARQAMLLCGCIGITFFAFSEHIYAIMTNDPAVRQVGVPAFRFLAFAQPFLGLAIVYMSALRGAGDTRWPMLFTILGGCFIRVPVAYLGAVVFGGGLIGAWCGMWTDNVTRCGLAAGRFAHGGWKRVKV